MIKNAILPGNIDVSGHFWDTFGRCETENAARALVKLFQARNPRAWEPMPEGTADFCLSDLECNEMLTVTNGMLSVTDEFVRRVSKFATIENFDDRGLPCSRDQLISLGGPFSIGWRDRGLGHGDFGILDREGKLIAKVVSGREDHARVLAASAMLLEGCKKALSCASIDSSVRKLIETIVAETQRKPYRPEVIEEESP